VPTGAADLVVPIAIASLVVPIAIASLVVPIAIAVPPAQLLASVFRQVLVLLPALAQFAPLLR
jgi:hypothetical protein